MPVFRSAEGAAPDWCELEYFEIVDLQAGQRHEFPWRGPKEKLIVGDGSARISFGGETVNAEQKANLDLTGPGSCFVVEKALTDCTVIRMCGRWGDELGGSGLFWYGPVDEPNNVGDPVDWPMNTTSDNHWHDCDEYWIVYGGRGIAASEGKLYEVGPGDCVATGMGHHHQMPRTAEAVRAVFFETTMEGQKRPGHLWNHTHGEPEPRGERT